MDIAFRISSSFGSSTRRGGFTLIEMLTVIAIITLLLGLLLPGLASVKTSARMTRELTSARQAMQAYTNYANNNKDWVLPGYLAGLPAYGPDKKPLPGTPAASRYPWRLAPYLDYQVGGLFNNAHGENYEQWLNQQDYYAISLFPSLGLNTAWMGGSQNQYAILKPDPNDPNAFDNLVWGKFWVSRLTEVNHPDRLLVFSSARGQGNSNTPGSGASGLYEGWHEVLSPYFMDSTGLRWSDAYVQADNPSDFGHAALRFHNKAVVAFVDGHAQPMNEDELKDMRHWANGAKGEDWLPEADVP